MGWCAWIRKSWLGLAAILLIVGCSHQASHPSGQARRDATLTDTISAAMQRASLPGVIVGIWQDGRAAPYVRAFGLRDTGTGAAMTTDLAMRVGSVTKTFVTTAILQLVDQQKVGLDDPIAKYVADVPNGDNITVRQLGQMRSGLYSYTNEVIPNLPNQPYRQWTPQELLRISYDRPPLFAPGAEWDYSNTNTMLLGLVVEKAAGQPLKSYLEQHITGPKNLTHTVFPTDAHLPNPHAQGYTAGPNGQTVDGTDWSPSWGWAAGNMISTVDDLGSWARDLATGTLISPASQREREKFLLAPSEGTGSLYGLGVENQNGWIGHNGNITGFQAYAYHLPAEHTTMVVLANANTNLIGLWNLVTEIVKIVTPAHPWPAPPA